MSDKLRYSISAVPDGFFRGGSVQGFEVHMVVAADDIKTFDNHVARWQSGFHKFHERTAEAMGVKVVTKNYKIRITDLNDGSHVLNETDFSVCCSEEEIMYSLLYATAASECDVFFEEINYKGCRCTEISDICPLDRGYQFFSNGEPDHREQSFPIQLQAVLNGSYKGTLYFFGPYIGTQENDYGIVYSYPLSNGIFTWDNNNPERLYYAGMFPVVKNVEVIAEDGKTKKGNMQEMAHTFCSFYETDTVEVTFSMLLDGRLYPKINKNEKRVIFYCTPFYQNLDGTMNIPGGFEYGKSPYDAIFQRVDSGEYLYITDFESRFRGVMLTPPQEFYVEIDGSPCLDTRKEALRQLLKEYVDAACASFFVADEYHAETGHVFNHVPNTNDEFFVKTDGFDLLLMPNINFYGMPESLGIFERWDAGFIFGIEGARFIVDNVEVILIPQRDSELGIEVVEPEQEKSLLGKFSELEKTGFFAGAGLPQRIQFDISLAFFIQNIKLYKAIKSIIEADVHKFTGALREIKQGISLEDMDDRLYEGDEIQDKEFITFAVELQSKFKRTRVIPNIALFGEAGTGKSTMAKRLAEAVFHKDILEVTPSSLKPCFVGWADISVYRAVSTASEKNAIVFIDEAYELMTDKFGKEVVTILLPLMEKRRPEDKIAANGEKLEWSAIKEIPPIWIAGYEDKTRLMLNENAGLYRRLEAGMLTPPTTSELYNELLKLLEKAKEAITNKEDSELFDVEDDTDDETIRGMKHKFEVLLKQFTDNEKLIKNYFQWGAQPQNSKYFAHHAGVRTFINKCLGRIDFSKGSAEITDQIEQVIRLRKREISHQVDTVRRDAEGGLDVMEKVEIITENGTRFKDLVGCDAQITYMNNILDMIVNKSYYEKNNVTVPKGALLLGVPGVGKTFIARAMAGELQERFAGTDEKVGFIVLSASMLTAQKETFISSLFEKIEELFDACIIFIDEVDSIAKNRVVNPYASHLLELIKQMDGIEQRSKIFILAATNAGESLDPAFTRPGRIDKKMEFYLPDLDARRELVKRNIEKRSGLLANFKYEEHEKDVDELAGKVAARTPNYTPGAIEVIVNTAFMMYDREKKTGENTSEQEQKTLPFENAVSNEAGAGKTENVELEILLRQLYEAIEIFEVGELRSIKEDEVFNVEKNNESRSSTAIHEVGHALISILLGISIEKITSLPRGHALGYVSSDRERSMVTKEDFEKRIRTAMGGRAAEEIIYGKDRISVGASQDMRTATDCARLMAELWGFTEELGFMALMQDTARHLGQSAYTCSDSFREHSDQVVGDLLKKQYVKTMTMLEDKRELIIKLAEKVFREKTMTGEEFKKFYEDLTSNKGRAGSENPA